MLKKILSMAVLMAAVGQAAAQTPSPAGAMAYIISPADGAVVSSPLTVTFGLKGMGVAPAGTDRANTGHHHLLVDAKGLPAVGQPMGADVIHFGGGQTETSLELAPGKHTLQLIMGDMGHVPHHPVVVSKVVTITVK
ncbi:DUF4399 domain-containing protein [Dasania marina]|uniref:DUF4399 domain-containing protein n=1 Tax=Dasania marina TaxID=471499 RepID=UPI0030D95CC9|tara:strand:- start:97979 stop:98389 length:411 start_codon:yes stop_codon:yes gene_type:complete